jgi:phage shock protein PspC (stress-responsive transcriptional regulator)
MNSHNPMKKCPYCAEMINDDAVKCRYCGSWLDSNRFAQTWTRSRNQKRIAGVCAGLAKQLGIPVIFLRVAFIVLTFFSGLGIIVYVSLWLLMPYEDL